MSEFRLSFTLWFNLSLGRMKAGNPASLSAWHCFYQLYYPRFNRFANMVAASSAGKWKLMHVFVAA